ncbi:MAG TPA: FUSC family protein [Streptosporangiaceae bacterium]|nr:FUSC family protein [Streptosporangiaceae bacterium]
MSRAAAVRTAVVPGWLAEVVRPRRAPVPWPEMIRAALAICVPLSVAFALGRGPLGVLPATGGLLGTLADTGGPYLSRMKRVATAAAGGGAAGLAIGAVTHGHGWLAVVALVVVAGVSGVLSTAGDLGSVTGLQLLVYTALGAGPLGALRPVWHTAAGFLVGVLWALILLVPGWLRAPYGREQRDVAAVYDALAGQLAAVGTEDFTIRRQAVTGALDTAYDELLTARTAATGLNRRRARLLGALNASVPVGEAAIALGLAGTRPPPLVVTVVSRLADAIRTGSWPPMIPPPWDDSPATLALRDALAGASAVLSRDRPEVEVRARPRRPVRQVLFEKLGAGTLGRIFTLRLMVCMGVAGLVSEVIPLQRSYWVPLTVAIVLKPDFGSVFARALQRGIGTVAGAVAGAVLLVLVHGMWLLIPFAILAALLPYGRSRNYGLLSTFLTPLVVVLIDLLAPVGWQLAEDRLIDTLIGCAIALLVGFAPWPMVWYSHLPRQYAQTGRDMSRYLEEVLGGQGPDAAAGVSSRARLRRPTYRALADLRAEFQRTMSEPPSISRRAAAWWPAVIGLEQVMDAITSAGLAASQDQGQAASPDGVRRLCDALRVIEDAARTGMPLAEVPGLPDEEVLKPVSEAIRALLGVLGPGQRLTLEG